jgi:threonine/homoserine/homoserine lactone efflux protein
MDSLLPLTLFAFVSSITPGPNNIMLTSSGMRFGFLRTLPHLFGISFGFCILMALCASGVGSLVLAIPALHVVLKTLGSAYLVYLAWQLRDMGFAQAVPADARPLSFTGAALFQFANPKAWMMGVTGASAFLPMVQPVSLAIALYCVVFITVGFPCIVVWAGAGAVLRRYLAQRRWQLLFCGVMIVLTLYSALAIWL